MSRRMRRPETVRIPLTRGDWILVKKHLNAGESRQAYTRTLKTIAAGGTGAEIDPMQIGLSQAVEYLLDWSFEDPEGNVIQIRDQPAGVIEAALNGLDQESYLEVVAAIEQHDDKMAAERAAEKNVPDGETPSSPISPSPNTSAGSSNG